AGNERLTARLAVSLILPDKGSDHVPAGETPSPAVAFLRQAVTGFRSRCSWSSIAAAVSYCLLLADRTRRPHNTISSRPTATPPTTSLRLASSDSARSVVSGSMTGPIPADSAPRSEEHTSELQS